MRILAIETSCDDTGISVVSINSRHKNTTQIDVLGDAVLSQHEFHAPYGGVFPTIAKREHKKNIIPILTQVLNYADILQKSTRKRPVNSELIRKHLEREPELIEPILHLLQYHKKPPLDYIAVTVGPGLEPALWVGINTARALACGWNLPLLPINHLEGHLVASRALRSTKAKHAYNLHGASMPHVGLIASGGHTELVTIDTKNKYRRIGSTRDDAAGEAFDKVARILKLPYPGGPEISRAAQQSTAKEDVFELPRPMINSKDLDFSFSGLKTAVLYRTHKVKRLTQKYKQDMSREFQDAVVDVLVSKTIRAAKDHNAKSISLGGGVSANEPLRKKLVDSFKIIDPTIKIHIPPLELTGDNATMIAIAAGVNLINHKAKQLKCGSKTFTTLKANSSLELSS